MKGSLDLKRVRVTLLLISLLLGSTLANVETQLKILKVKTGSNNGDGMDGGFMRNKNWGGGRFSFTFKNPDGQECQTGILNTDEDNWEVGETNFFVGRQIGGCNGFDLSNGNLTLTVQHSGTVQILKILTIFKDESLTFLIDKLQETMEDVLIL